MRIWPVLLLGAAALVGSSGAIAAPISGSAIAAAADQIGFGESAHCRPFRHWHPWGWSRGCGGAYYDYGPRYRYGYRYGHRYGSRGGFDVRTRERAGRSVRGEERAFRGGGERGEFRGRGGGQPGEVSPRGQGGPAMSGGGGRGQMNSAPTGGGGAAPGGGGGGQGGGGGRGGAGGEHKQ